LSGPFFYLYVPSLLFLWYFFSLWMPIRPHPAVLRDWVSLSLFYVDDNFLFLPMFRGLFIIDILVICVRATSSIDIRCNIFEHSIPWVYVMTTLLFSHVVLLGVSVYSAAAIFQRELVRLTNIVREYKGRMPKSSLLSSRQWEHYNRRLSDQKLLLSRYVWTAGAISLFVLSFVCYILVLKPPQ
jgi:hypothetical protein